MKIYAVWDFDPMDGSMGNMYLADLFLSLESAEDDVRRRNKYWQSKNQGNWASIKVMDAKK